ncbi:MAG: hypothetical protein AAGA35_00885 [Patescibacteria group bacterium]
MTQLVEISLNWLLETINKALPAEKELKRGDADKTFAELDLDDADFFDIATAIENAGVIENPPEAADLSGEMTLNQLLKLLQGDSSK